MPDFSKRSTQAELMDTEEAGYDDYAQCLHHLALINTYTLAYNPTLKWIKELRPATILDVGSGGGDMMRKISKKSQAAITGADMNPYSKRYADALTPDNAPLSYVTENAFDLNFEDKPDAIISSLFTHHLSDEELVTFIKWMNQTAQKGWLINDLHRHPIAYYFIKAVTVVFPFHRFVKHDAAISVARAFTRKDWINFLNAANIPEYRTKITWHFPFRYCVSCRT
jgi:2-polyprenyl-3-methyl-5-hydroxy-6-metoxy-1,4-benzoquinol methylase